MNVLKWLDKHLEEVLLSVFLLTLIVLTSLNVVLRYVFNSGLTWSDEICKDCLIFSGFASISYWIRNKSGICVDAFVGLMPEGVKKVFGAMVQVIVLLFFIWMFRGAVNVMQSIAKSNQVSATLQIPMWYIYLAPVIGFGLAVVRQVQIIVLDVIKARKGGNE